MTDRPSQTTSWRNLVPGEYLQSFDPSSLSIESKIVIACAASSILTLATRRFYTRHIRRIPTADQVNPELLKKRPWIKGVVTSVGDNDNFRLYHTPGYGWRWPLKLRSVPNNTKELRGQTIHIRIAGIDAPEAAHFGRPGQPYAEEAFAWLKKQVENKRIWCQLLHKDQYNRIVAIPVIPSRIPFFRDKYLPLMMLKAGWATVYEQANAVYGKWGKSEYLRLQAEAQAAKRGIWVQGEKMESPAEYKKRYANLSASKPPQK